MVKIWGALVAQHVRFCVGAQDYLYWGLHQCWTFTRGTVQWLTLSSDCSFPTMLGYAKLPSVLSLLKIMLVYMHGIRRITVDLLISFNTNINTSFNQYTTFLCHNYIHTSVSCFVLGLNAPASGWESGSLPSTTFILHPWDRQQWSTKLKNKQKRPSPPHLQSFSFGETRNRLYSYKLHPGAKMSHGYLDTILTILTCPCLKGWLQVYHEGFIIWGKKS